MPVGKLNPFNPDTEDFDAWIGVLSNYLIANDVDKSTKEPKAIAIFLSSVGVPTYTLLQDLTSPKAPETMKYDELVTTLKNHYKPAPKAISERYKFFSRKQQMGESVNLFLSELRKLAVTCKFGNLDISLRDQFVFGLSCEAAQKRLFLEDDNLTLIKAVSIAISQEAAEKSTQLVRSNGSPPILTSEFTNKVQIGQNSYRGKDSSDSQIVCPNCGRNHPRKDCPHKDVECYKCQKKGHFAKMCRSSSPNPSTSTHNRSGKSKVQTVKQVSSKDKLILIRVELNGNPKQMELDTASSKSFISPEIWREIGSPKLVKTNSRFTTYTGQPFEAKGLFICKVFYNGQSVLHRMHVASGTSLFGRDLLNKLQMDWSSIKSQCSQVNRVSEPNDSLKKLLFEFSDVFDAPVGRISNFKAKLVLRDDAVPRFFKARPVPFAIREKVDRELERMEKSGVITRVDHSDWASPLVVVPKADGRVRITGDFKKTINSQLCITQYPLARVEDLFEKILAGTTFSKLDGSDAFHQVEVEESSRMFLVINTHRGLYRYNVLPQGIASSPAIFQELMDNMLKAIPMTGSFVDDVIASGKDEQHHLHNLKQILQKMRECNYRVSRTKCLFLQQSVKFLGQVVCPDGIRTDPGKIESILSMPVPQNVSEVKSFLGLVNFYAKFVPNMSHQCEPLNELTRTEVKWKWSKQCQTSFEHIKRCVSTSPVLAHFNQSLPIGISCDASSVGVGIVLFHKYKDGSERPIAFASKTLSSAERNYSQIEKEGLAIIYGVKRFHQFLYGRRFILVTDHNPLLAIFGQNREVPSLVASRLHRWSLFLSGFTYDIVYCNTKSHGNADALSRLPLVDDSKTDDPSEEVKQITEDNPVTSKVVRFRTSRDAVLSVVQRHVMHGWPKKQTELPEEIQPNFSHRHEFNIEQGILMWGIRVVVPTSLRTNLLSQLHDTHPGIVRMKSMARQYVWWPGIDKDIETLVKSCISCAVHSDNPSVAPLHPWSYPEKPWQRIHIDLAGPFMHNMWLVIVDAHTKWPEVYKLGKDSTFAKVINCVRETFCRFGIPETVVSDNGPQFVSREFEQFCSKNGVRHTTSSAYHPRSNGEAERFVRTFKNAMTSSGNHDLNLSLCQFLLNYRVTPHATTGAAPSELMMKRHVRTLLDLIRPDPKTTVHISQEKQKEQFDGTSGLREFREGQHVWVQSFGKDQPKWSLGKIVKPMGPVSYQVEVSKRVMKRHVDHILCAEVITSKLSNDVAVPLSPQKPMTPIATNPRSPITPPRDVGSPVQAPNPIPRRAPSVIDLTFDDEEEPSITQPSTSRPRRDRRFPDRYQSEPL